MAEEKHIHLVSDATGETVTTVARACLVQFDDGRVVEHVWPLIRTPFQMEKVIDSIGRCPGAVLFTLVNPDLRTILEEGCRHLGLPAIPVLDPVVMALGSFLGAEAKALPGRQHEMDAEYFSRIDAMHFVLAHDDGHGTRDIDESDVIIVGVSRTSKTPTCIYLANRGVKASNIPFVPGCPLPPELDEATRPLVVGLTKDPRRLVQVRKNRLKMLNQAEETDYVDLESVGKEVTEARRLFARKGWPVIDVTRKSIEETAASILQLLATRRRR